ncbi:MAG: transcriptional regulator [Bacteroidia bacterium]
MKDALDKLNKVFENRVRLGIMSLLMVEEWVDFVYMKQTLDVSDGNLASHLKQLRASDYIEERKEFLDRRPHTTYRATEAGRQAFAEHLDALEQIIRGFG